jgi:hypothetical protein
MTLMIKWPSRKSRVGRWGGRDVDDDRRFREVHVLSKSFLLNQNSFDKYLNHLN